MIYIMNRLSSSYDPKPKKKKNNEMTTATNSLACDAHPKKVFGK